MSKKAVRRQYRSSIKPCPKCGKEMKSTAIGAHSRFCKGPSGGDASVKPTETTTKPQPATRNPASNMLREKAEEKRREAARLEAMAEELDRIL